MPYAISSDGENNTFDPSEGLIRLTFTEPGGFLHTVMNSLLSPMPISEIAMSCGSVAPMHSFHASAADTTTYSWRAVFAAKQNKAAKAFAVANTKRSPQRFGEPLT